MSFFSTVVPVIMRQEHYSLESIGLLQLIKLPWIAKFLWAPLVDRTAIDLRAYKKWIIISEIVYAILIFSIGFLSLQIDFKLIIFLVVLAFIASGTQDIATDAFAIIILKPSERAFGNSMQSAGSFTGTLVGSGVLLVLYYYFGWTLLLICLSFFVLIPLIPLLFYKNGKIAAQKVKERITLADLYRFFLMPGMFKRVILLVFYYSGIIGVLAMLKPFMVDHGYSAKEIGIMSGITGSTIGALSAMAAGFIIKTIGRRKSLITFAFVSLSAALYFWHLSRIEVTDVSIYTGILLIWMAYGLSSVAIFTTSMDIVRKGREGTDFTIQIVITHLSSIFMAVMSGRIADNLGYGGLYTLEIFLCIATILILFYVYPKNMNYDVDNKTA
jgi:MFS family permease